MAIDNKRFVDVNIVYNQQSSSNTIRDTVVVFTSAAALSTVDKIYASQTEYNNDTAVYNKDTTLDAFIKTYFDNGGNKVRVKYTAAASLSDSINALDNEYIVVAYAAASNYTTMQSAASSRQKNSKIYGINQKILLASYNNSAFTGLSPTENFAVKYSKNDGAEMTIAAYLSNVDINGINTIHDYNFTQENLTPETADDTVLGKVLDNNLNVVMRLAGVNRNLGGNLTDGSDLVNQYTLIVLHQTLTEKVINCLAQKIKGSTGLSALYSVISNELTRYTTCGYLTTDKVWLKPTLTVAKNNNTYTLIEKGTPLINGYNITILPLSSLTDEEKSKHQAPYIYIVLADSYGIRTVTINGEVI